MPSGEYGGDCPDGTRESLAALSASDLQTLLLSVSRMRAARVRPADLLRRWREDRFVQPATSDPRALSALEARMWRLLPAEFEGVELSPVAPLGTCSAVSPQSQDRIVSTVRTAEVVSDSTNALAIEAALRITAGEAELGDGGFTTWTAQLMGNAKERCLVSCLPTERLLAATNSADRVD